MKRLLIASILAATTMATATRAAEPLPIFDAHMHYSAGAWLAYAPDEIFKIMDAAGVHRALVSSTPDDGTLRLAKFAPERVAPFLRPYRGEVRIGNWTTDPDLMRYIEERLKIGRHLGVGEVHIARPDEARAPALRPLLRLLAERGLYLQVHTDAAPIHALYEIEPTLKIILAHAGFTEPAAVVGGLLDRYPGLITELSFRAHDIMPGTTIDAAWRAMLIKHADRIMIGTDTYTADRWAEYQGLIADHRRWLATLPPEVARAIAHGTANRLFGTGSKSGG